MQIPSMPAYPSSDLQIVPPGAPSHVPCPLCQYPLERGEYCTSHRADGVTVLCQGPDKSLDEHQNHPLLVLPGICYLALHKELNPSNQATQGSDSSRSLPIHPPLALPSPPTVQHARSLPAHSSASANIPAGSLCVRESVGQ